MGVEPVTRTRRRCPNTCPKSNIVHDAINRGALGHDALTHDALDHDALDERCDALDRPCCDPPRDVSTQPTALSALCFTRCRRHPPPSFRETGAVTSLPGGDLMFPSRCEVTNASDPAVTKFGATPIDGFVCGDAAAR